MSLHDLSRECGYDLDTDLSDYYVFIHVTATGILLFKATRANKSSLASTISRRRQRKDKGFKAGSLSVMKKDRVMAKHRRAQKNQKPGGVRVGPSYEEWL